jgi:elongation factor Tu
VHTITGRGTVVTGAIERGTVVTGAIERGTVTLGDTVELVGHPDPVATVATGVETFVKTMTRGEAGRQRRLLLRGVRRDQVRRGQVVAARGTVTPHDRFTAQGYLLTGAEGGPHTPITSGYRSQI